MKRKHIFYNICICAVLCLGFLFVRSTKVSATAIYPTDVTTAESGNRLVGIKGSYITDIDAALSLINKYRKEACSKGYINPETGKRLKSSDYVPIKWSSEMERQARIRSAEASIYPDHTRPSGKDCFDLVEKEIYTSGEVLAWGGYSMKVSVSLWYTEKNDWVKQNKNAVTGHYEAMINPTNRYVGLGLFYRSGYMPACCGRFSKATSANTSRGKAVNNCIQTIEIPNSKLVGRKISISTSMTVGSSQFVGMTYGYGNQSDIRLYLVNELSWKSNRKAVMVDEKGNCKAVTVGVHKVTFTYSGSRTGSVTKTITVRPKKTSVSKATKGSRTLTLRIRKVTGISGYQVKVYKGSSRKAKYYNVRRSASSAKIKITSKSTKYTYYIRTYKKVGKRKIYSYWSSGHRK